MIAFNSVIGTITPYERGRTGSLANPAGSRSLAPVRLRSRWFSAAALRQAIAALRQREPATLDIPEAIGATDRELARLSPDYSRRVLEGTRHANQRLLDATMMRYR